MSKAISIIVFISILASLWQPVYLQFDANCFGNRNVLVYLFEWRWDDIATECERFLAKKGFCGVQISPPNENRVIMNDKEKRPWHESYQPVSYKTMSRSGDETAFSDMITRCNKVGVRIYVDAVLNHMVAEESGQGSGIAGSQFDAATLDFPGAHYNSSHFHSKGNECKTDSGRVESYDDPDQVRNCRYNGLVDLNQANSYVRQTMAEWLNRLIDFGVAGFRIHAAKYMSPDDLRAIVGMLNPLNTNFFPAGSKPFIYQDVADLGYDAIKSSEYSGYGRVTEYNYGKYLSDAFHGRRDLYTLKTLGQGWGYLLPDNVSISFIDNAENQRSHWDGGSTLNFFTAKPYKMAVAFLLAWPYGQARVLSSYRWERNFKGGVDQNDWIGPPHDDNWNINPVTINADGISCSNGWVCEHRWRAISSMVWFRNVAGYEPVQNWWDDGENQIAFSRSNKAFFAVNAGSREMTLALQTGMKPGQYCDVISGERSSDGNSCSGKIIEVDAEGKAMIYISKSADEPLIAIHKDSILGDYQTDITTMAPPPSTYHRTVIFIYYRSMPGEDLFLNGGLDHSRRDGCESNPRLCEIPISYAHASYPAQHYDGYNAWSKGDNYLGWSGAEPDQGTFNGKQAQGSPMAWTTNWPTTDQAYHPLNSYGMHYWMIDISADCSVALDDWFEIKANVNGRWEHDIYQGQGNTCSGNAGVLIPFSSRNHVVKCGYKNVFVWEKASCEVDFLT